MLKRKILTKTQKKKKGQSTVEYILLVAAVLGALIVFLRPGGVFQNAFNGALQSTTNTMTNMAGRLSTSIPNG